MEKKKAPLRTIDNDILARVDRFATNFPEYLQRLEKESQKIGENLPKITLEVEEFKKVQTTLTPALSAAIRKVLIEERNIFVTHAVKVLKEEIDSVLKECRHQTKEMTQKYLEDGEKFKTDVEKTVSTLKQLLNLQKQRLTYKGLLICFVFCTASVLTGMGLFYLFPQNIYYSDPNVARYMMMGRATWENMKYLSVKDQNLLLDGMKKYMAKK
jgi:pheromone shutdown protein TraB